MRLLRRPQAHCLKSSTKRRTAVPAQSACSYSRLLVWHLLSRVSSYVFRNNPFPLNSFDVLGIMTGASRMTHAFARDNGLPFSRTFAHINSRFRVPLASLVLTTVLCVIFGCIYLGSSSALNAILSSSVVALNISYSIPGKLQWYASLASSAHV